MPEHRGDRRHHPARRLVKNVLGAVGDLPSASTVAPSGATVLIYHRVGAGTPDELDVATRDFARQVEVLQDAPVVSLDEAVDALDAGVDGHRVVLTFDDGFRDVYHAAWPLLRRAQLPFTLYLASAYVDRLMRWPGSTAVGAPGSGLDWDQLREMHSSGLMTIANHTHDHALPEQLSAEQVDRCAEAVERELGASTEHFAYTWGVPVPAADDMLRERFRSAATGELGRTRPGDDLLRLHRVPVRGSDPLRFFRAKLTGGLTAERRYAGLVEAAKSAAGRGRS